MRITLQKKCMTSMDNSNPTVISMRETDENQKWIGEIIDELNNLSEVPDGWDGIDSKGPKPETVLDAKKFVQYWHRDWDVLEPELAYDGTIALQMYDQNRFTKGGISFLGNHKAVYSIVKRTQKLASNSFDASSISEIKKIISEIGLALKNKI